MFEYTYPFHYGLSFASATESESYKPELVFLVNPEHWSELSERILVLTEKMRHYAQQYSHDISITFSQCSLENIEQAPFGYDNCAYVQIQDEQLQIHFVLTDTTVKFCALTINTITLVLSCVCRISVPKRSFQTIDLSTLSGTEHLFHRHAIGGNISTNITDWLQKYVRNTKPNATEHDILYLPNEIILAMKETWGYIHTKPLSKK